MLKPLIVATAALAIAGSSIVYAQQHFGGPGGFGDGLRFEYRHRPSAEDMAAFTDARIAALKAGLELTPDQAKNWPAFEQALRDLAQLRIQRVQAHRAREQNIEQGHAPAAPFDRLARLADNMAKTSSALKRVADAGTPLYQSLNDAQKARFEKLARILRPHHHRHFVLYEGGRGGWQGRPWWGHQGRRFGQDQGPLGNAHPMTGSEDQGSEL